jgi:hypothetical protein
MKAVARRAVPAKRAAEIFAVPPDQLEAAELWRELLQESHLRPCPQLHCESADEPFPGKGWRGMARDRSACGQGLLFGVCTWSEVLRPLEVGARGCERGRGHKFGARRPADWGQCPECSGGH